jgi:transposase
MKKEPIFVRAMREEEKQVLEKARRAADACEMKRSQILLASSQGLTTTSIEKQFGYSAEYARQMIHRFNKQGIECLKRKSSAPKTQETIVDKAKCEQIKQLMHKSPRLYGKASSLWTLTLVAEVLSEEGATPRRMANETIRTAMRKNGISWKRAKDWISSPDPQYELKKTAGAVDTADRG